MSPRPTNEHERLMLKSIVRRLLQVAGGVTSFAIATRVEAPALSKYASPDDAAAHIPFDVAMDLMRDTGSVSLLAAAAEMLGYDLVPRDQSPQAAALPDANDVSKLIQENTGVVSAVCSAIADGVVTPEEGRRICTEIDEEQRFLDGLRRKVQRSVKGGDA